MRNNTPSSCGVATTTTEDDVILRCVVRFCFWPEIQCLRNVEWKMGWAQLCMGLPNYSTVCAKFFRGSSTGGRLLWSFWPINESCTSLHPVIWCVYYNRCWPAFQHATRHWLGCIFSLNYCTAVCNSGWQTNFTRAVEYHVWFIDCLSTSFLLLPIFILFFFLLWPSN